MTTPNSYRDAASDIRRHIHTGWTPETEPRTPNTHGALAYTVLNPERRGLTYRRASILDTVLLLNRKTGRGALVSEVVERVGVTSDNARRLLRAAAAVTD